MNLFEWTVAFPIYKAEQAGPPPARVWPQLHPDGERAFAEGKGPLKLYDPFDAKAPAVTFPVRPSGVSAVWAAADGKRAVTVGRSGVVSVWEVPAAGGPVTPAGEFRGHVREVTGAVLPADGKLLVLAHTGGRVTAHDAGTGAEMARFESTHNLSAVGVRWDGREVAVGDLDGGVRLLRLPDLKEQRTLDGKRSVLALAYHPTDDRLAVARWRAGEVRSTTGDAVVPFRGTVLSVVKFGIQFSPDGTRVLTGSGQMFDPESGMEVFSWPDTFEASFDGTGDRVFTSHLNGVRTHDRRPPEPPGKRRSRGRRVILRPRLLVDPPSRHFIGVTLVGLPGAAAGAVAATSILAFGFIWAMTASRSRMAYTARTASFACSNVGCLPGCLAVTSTMW